MCFKQITHTFLSKTWCIGVEFKGKLMQERALTSFILHDAYRWFAAHAR